MAATLVVRQEFCIQQHVCMKVWLFTGKLLNAMEVHLCLFVESKTFLFSIKFNCSESNFFLTKRKSQRTPSKKDCVMMASQVSSTGHSSVQLLHSQQLAPMIQCRFITFYYITYHRMINHSIIILKLTKSIQLRTPVLAIFS